MQPAAPKGGLPQDFPRSRNRLRIGTGNPKFTPLISRDEAAAALRALGCEVGLIEERGPTNFVITVREEDISKVEGLTLQIRNHRTRVDVFLLKSRTDQRMELPSAPAENFKTIDIKFYSDVPQPFAPAPRTEHVMKLVVKNFAAFTKRVFSIDLSNTKHFHVDLAQSSRWRNVDITNTRPLTILFTFRQLDGLVGVYRTAMFLNVETLMNGLQTTDRIRTEVEVRIGDKALADALAPKGEYVEKKAPEMPRKIILAFPEGRATKEHIHTPHERKYAVALEHYETPPEIQKQINEGDSYKDFQVWNTKDKWRQRLHQLLWWEEAYGRKQVTKYDLWDVPIVKVKARTEEPAAEIEVPGLEEKRPSLLKGDRVYVWQLSRGDEAAYEGIVWEVKKSSIVALFGLSFYNEDPNSRWHVRFTYDRLAMRVKHRAVDAVDLDIVYPETMQCRQHPATMFPFIDLSIANNKKQSLAIRSLMARTTLDRDSGRSLPYLLLGPFGTGKTRCLVEYVQQVLADATAKVLFCSFSNSTADRFCELLAGKLTPKEMFRLNAFRRERGSVAPAVWRYTAYLEATGVFDLPSLEELQSYRVIVCTAANAGSLYGLGCPRTHFTHIVIDEAARLEEPECLIPLSLATVKTQVVLAGDPKQLGPKVQSSRTKMHGLEKSLIERLCQYHLYADKDERVCMHLTTNYRSHASIVSVLNRVFYENIGLTSAAPSSITHSLVCWTKRNTLQSFPFLFISSSGSLAQREADSPSFFNVTEAEICAQILLDLFSCKDIKVKPTEIGVLPATRKQTERIRTTLRIKGLNGIDVGSVEEAHGKEFKVVVLSCVATARGVRSVEQDRLHDIGFCANGKRINTAISRAAALVIIIGDPYRLANDPQWKQLIDLCRENKSYIDAGSGDALVVSEPKDADEVAQLAEKAREEALVKEQQLKKAAVEQERKEREKQQQTAAVAAAHVASPLASPVAASTPPPRAAAKSPAPASALSPLAAPFSPARLVALSTVPNSTTTAIRSNLAPVSSAADGGWPSPFLHSPIIPLPARQPMPSSVATATEKLNDKAEKQAAPTAPAAVIPQYLPYVSGFPPFFVPVSSELYQSMLGASPVGVAGLQYEHEPEVVFESKYRSLNCKWNKEDLVSYRVDSSFIPPFRVQHFTEGDEKLIIEVCTVFLAPSEVKSEGRTLLFSFSQPRPQKELYFQFNAPLPGSKAGGSSHLRITVPPGVRLPIDVSAANDKLTFTISFLSDSAPVTLQVAAPRAAKQ